MKFSENWLRTFVDPKLPSDELAHALTMAGLEVEALQAVAPAFDKVVVGEVLEVAKHPGADRLNVCLVNIGASQPLNIVCGAANVAVGVKVPCALIGAVLPGDFAIKQAKVRGVESFGMLCSAKELGLAEDSAGLLILPGEAPVGKSLRTYLELDDKIFTLKLTPNRSDCSGMVGVAREVAALTGAALKPLDIKVTPATLSEQWPVNVADAVSCPLYCGRIVRNVNAAAPTPTWMLRRLERGGLRSINAIVDITNYVMLEMGQPMHAFDLDKLSGGIQVRKAHKAEPLTLLNGQAVILDQDVLVIADQKRALAMAGIMGGQGSGVDTTTQQVFLESAFFEPNAIAGKARRFGLATDSSFRFERGVDFATTRDALQRATQLLLEICGGSAGAISAGEISEVRGQLPVRPPIKLRRARVARVLGIALDNVQITTLLTRLQFDCVAKGDDYLVTPPSFRFDLTIEEDLIEELARLHGYDNIPAFAPQATLNMLPDSESQRPVARIQRLLVARDYQEIVSYTFVEEQLERELCGNEQPVALQNPIASNLAVMRSSLICGLVGALRFNLNRKQSRVRLFEVGACFGKVNIGTPVEKKIKKLWDSYNYAQQNPQIDYSQQQRLSGLAYGAAQAEQWGIVSRPVDFYDVKADVVALFAPQVLRFTPASHPALHPGRSARIHCVEKAIGWIGELHPHWQQQYDLAQPAVWFEVELDTLMQADIPRMSEINKFLPARRDLAVLVDETIATQTLINAMQQVSDPCVVEIALFDLYRGKGLGEGKKSLAFRVLLQDTQKTLTDIEIDHSMSRLLAALQQHGAQLRE